MPPFPPQGQPQQPQPAAPAAAAGAPPMAPAPAGGPETSGLQKVANTEFNQQMQNILFSRIEEEGQKNPNFGNAIDSGITREAAMELALILPELHPIFRAMGLFEGMGDAPIGPAAPGQPAPPAGGQPAAPAFPGAAPADAGAGDGDPEDAADGGDDEEEEDNPLLRNGPASQGLVG